MSDVRDLALPNASSCASHDLQKTPAMYRDAQDCGSLIYPYDEWVSAGKMSDRTIAVWGHYHGGNSGDDLVVATIVAAIRRRTPSTRIIGISLAPADTRARHRIDAYPINPKLPGGLGRNGSVASDTTERPSLVRRLTRRVGLVRWFALGVVAVVSAAIEIPFAVRSYRLLREIDLVVVAGSGQLDEWQGTWYHPWTLFRWSWLARLARVPMTYLSVGAGPIDGRLSAHFVRSAVASAERITVRDEHSRAVLASVGVSRPIDVCADMAYGLPDRYRRTRAATPAHGRRDGLTVGLSVMGYQDPRYWPRGEQRVYDQYLRKSAHFASGLLERGHTVRLCSQTTSDDLVAEDFRRLLGETQIPRTNGSSGAIDIRHLELRNLAETIVGCDVAVGARYHFILLCLLLDVPVIALSYHPKTSDLLARVGRPERVLDIAAFEEDDLTAAFTTLCIPDGDEARDALRARVANLRSEVERQFDDVFGPLAALMHHPDTSDLVDAVDLSALPVYPQT